jgi:hypothetical protein
MVLGLLEKLVATQLIKQSFGLYGITDQPMVLSLLEKLMATLLVTQSLGLCGMMDQTPWSWIFLRS